MTRNLKALGLALVAVLATSAVAAPVVSAASIFTSAKSGATIEAEDTGWIKFTLTGGEVVCKQAIFKGTAPSGAFEGFLVTPTYNNCTGFFFNATITGFGQYGETKKCVFQVRASGKVDLICIEGAEVTIDAGPCTVHIPEQMGLGTISYTNMAGGSIAVDLNITNIQASHTDGFLCPFAGSGSGKNGSMHGTTQAFGDGGKTAISWDA